MCLWEELRRELREDGFGACRNKDDNDNSLHLDDDDLDVNFLADLPTDNEAVEVAAEQRVLMASLETQRHDQSS
jgi:hypothetical protein